MRGNALFGGRDQAADEEERLDEPVDRAFPAPAKRLGLDDPRLDGAVDLEELRLGAGHLGRVAEVRLGQGLVGVQKRLERLEGVQGGLDRVG